MASPQLENGYLQIANEIVEALAKIRINGEAVQIFWVIIRKTYGYNKLADNISLSQFELATGLKKPEIIRAIKKLEQMHIVIGENANGKLKSYRICKDFEKWRPLAKKQINKTIGENANTSLAKKQIRIGENANTLITKDTITKNNTTKNKDLQIAAQTAVPPPTAAIIQPEHTEKPQPEQPIPVVPVVPVVPAQQTLQVKEIEIKEKKLTVYQEFVRDFENQYENETKMKYNSTVADYKNVTDLIKKHGVDTVRAKAAILSFACKNQKLWFTKNGFADFTIGKLVKFWNELIAETVQPEKSWAQQARENYAKKHGREFWE